MNNETARSDSDAPIYRIGAVARRTGLSADLIRAWENRYGAVTPARTSGGTRVYGEGEIERLIQLRQLTGRGHPIGEIASLPEAELGALVDRTVRQIGSSTAHEGEEARGAAEEAVARTLRAVASLSGRGIAYELMRTIVPLRPEEFVLDVALPLLREVGERWRRGDICPAHEHLLSSELRRVCGWLIDSLARSSDAPVLVTSTPAGEWHEFGAVLAGILAASHGWRVTHLGANLPAADIATAARQLGASAVALSVVGPGDAERQRHQVATLARSLPAHTALIVGGSEAPLPAPAGPSWSVLDGLDALQPALARLGRAPSADRRVV